MMLTTASGAKRAPHADHAEAGALLRRWLSGAVGGDAFSWLQQEIGRQQAGDERRLAVAPGLAGRKVGGHGLLLTADDIAGAQRVREGWQPQYWTTDEAARAA